MTAYIPTAWINDVPPPLSAANLNKLTVELRSQAVATGISQTLPTWVDGAAPALTDAAPLNELERVAQVVASALSLTYAPTAWSAGWTPARNATRFNRLEAQAAANRTVIDAGIAVPTFDKYASPSGSDANAGTLASPYRTFGKLCQSLTAGQTGALRGGSYVGDINITTNGTAANRIRVTSYPGEAPVVQGKIDVSGTYWTMDRFAMNSTGGSFMAWRAGLLLEYMDIYQSPRVASGIYIGGADDLEIRYCKFHDVGANYHFDHGIYAGKGARMHIHHNWIWNDNNGFGIQVYSNPTDSIFEYNIIDKCGSGFVIADDGGAGTCLRNLVYRNVVTSSVQMYSQVGPQPRNMLNAYPPSPGSNNRFTENCGYDNADGIGGAANVIMSGNFIANPLYVNQVSHDYRLQPGSPLATWGLWDGVRR